MPSFDKMHFFYTGILEVVRNANSEPIDVKAKFRTASAKNPNALGDPYLESAQDIYFLLTNNTSRRTTRGGKADLEEAFHQIMDERAKLGLPALGLKIN
jgi:hypothetical protein